MSRQGECGQRGPLGDVGIAAAAAGLVDGLDGTLAVGVVFESGDEFEWDVLALEGLSELREALVAELERLLEIV